MNLNKAQAQRLAWLVAGHGLCVLFIGLVAGLFLVFSLLGAVTLWPLPVWEVAIPGTTRGWSAAHVGGILNGVLLGVAALLMLHTDLLGWRAFWTGWGLIITGWANTVCYWAGNLAANRGLSVGATPFGEGDAFGAIAFLGGGIGMLFTFLAVALLALAAFAKAAR